MNTDSEKHKPNNIWKKVNYVNVHLKQAGSKGGFKSVIKCLRLSVPLHLEKTTETL